MKHNLTVRETVTALRRGELRCVDLAERALAAAESSDSVFVRVSRDILEQAARVDAARGEGGGMPALAGLPVSTKDLFDVQGELTLAGSVVLRREAKVCSADAEVVSHLRNAGALFAGRANMSEFAFSGMGLNPHYGNPKCIWERATGRLPGGSSSGSAVGIAEGIVAASVGSDTAGSCRAPAAFNGGVGVKPSFGRLSSRGMFLLSPSSDAPGPLANDLDGCFILDHVMMGRLKHGDELPELLPEKSFRLVVPEGIVMENLDAEVAAAFSRALEWLKDFGIAIAPGKLPALQGCVDMFAARAPAVFEAWQAHRERLEAHGDEYDPYVRWRIGNGRSFDAAKRAECYREKAELVAACAEEMRAARADALVYPTVQCVAPKFAEVASAEKMPGVNFRCLRNTSTVNFFDGCAVSLPCHLPGEAPVGLMLAMGGGGDERLYRIAGVVEKVLRADRRTIAVLAG